MSDLPNDGIPNDGTVELTESQLSDVAGGLPAVQKVREAAATSTSGSGGGARVKVFDGNGAPPIL
ncbi:hypothetical protein [Sandarakinorhabdus sp.]|uniref:hypothetical protein n=1 Tax=Sandarakinorhabdus sp. TaxID=1916663 RepID=UPI0033428584